MVHCMSKSQSMESHVIAMIHGRNKDNPILSREIERRLGISGVIIRDIVHRARTEQDIPICAESKGYFMPSNYLDAKRTIESLFSRAKQNREAAEGMIKHYKNIKQMRLL